MSGLRKRILICSLYALSEEATDERLTMRPVDDMMGTKA